MTDLVLRPASLDDLATITDLHARYDMHWLGKHEHSEAELAEELARASDTVLVVDGSTPVAAAWSDGPQTSVLVDPELDPVRIIATLADWLRASNGTLEVLSRDDGLRAALALIGWTHARSAFELIRPVGADWTLDLPAWPDGVAVTDLRAARLDQVHDLIYRAAGWAEVPGHVSRDLASWEAIFVTDRDPPEQQVLAWRGDVLVGVALGRIFDDGGGWVAQLAVAKTERRTGLGRALLLEALHRRIAAGASTLGLGVQAENDGALALYRGVGLRVEREWQVWAPPR